MDDKLSDENKKLSFEEVLEEKEKIKKHLFLLNESISAASMIMACTEIIALCHVSINQQLDKEKCFELLQNYYDAHMSVKAAMDNKNVPVE